jgi:hypothetical protein
MNLMRESKFLEDGPRWPKHVVNVIIRKVYLVAVEAKYLCFISDI